MSINMKGQSRASAQADAYLDSVKRGGPIRPVFLKGPAGCGKSHLATLLLEELAADGFSVHRYDSAADTARTVADCEATVFNPLTDGGRRAILIDEAHLLRGGAGISAAVAAAWKAALLPLGGDMPNWTAFPLVQGVEKRGVSWLDVALIFASNTPDRLEELASLRNGERPFQRRFRGIELSPYDDNVIAEVIGDFLTAKGLRAADCSRGLIARFHRGTLSAISEVVGIYMDLFPSHPTMSFERVLAAARLSQWFPRGLNRKEARLLKALSLAGGSVKRSLAAATIGCSPPELVGALAHLGAQRRKDGAPCPFAILSGPSVAITPAGDKYLSQILKEGFTL